MLFNRNNVFSKCAETFIESSAKLIKKNLKLGKRAVT